MQRFFKFSIKPSEISGANTDPCLITSVFWQNHFPGHLSQSLRQGSQAVKTQGAAREAAAQGRSGASASSLHEELEHTQNCNWREPYCCVLKCFPHLETSMRAFSVLGNGSCRVQHSRRAEAAGPASADVSFPAETSLTAGGLRGKHLSDMTPASQLELQAHKQLPKTPATANRK